MAPDSTQTTRTGELNAQVAGEAAKDSREPGPTAAPAAPAAPAVPKDTVVAPAEVIIAPPKSDEDHIREHLTSEEAKAILLDAANKKAAVKATDAQTAAEEELREDRKVYPLNYVGVDFGGNGNYTYIKLGRPPIAPDRTYVTGGLTYEHCDTDVDGVWLYRHMR